MRLVMGLLSVKRPLVSETCDGVGQYEEACSCMRTCDGIAQCEQALSCLRLVMRF